MIIGGWHLSVFSALHPLTDVAAIAILTQRNDGEFPHANPLDGCRIPRQMKEPRGALLLADWQKQYRGRRTCRNLGGSDIVGNIRKSQENQGKRLSQWLVISDSSTNFHSDHIYVGWKASFSYIHTIIYKIRVTIWR